MRKRRRRKEERERRRRKEERRGRDRQEADEYDEETGTDRLQAERIIKRTVAFVSTLRLTCELHQSRLQAPYYHNDNDDDDLLAPRFPSACLCQKRLAFSCRCAVREEIAGR